MSSYRIPAEPIRNLVQAWLDEDGNDVAKLAAMLFPDLLSSAAEDRIYHMLRTDRSNTIDFDLADLVLCRLDKAWLEIPELWAAYQEVDLDALDEARPVVDVAA